MKRIFWLLSILSIYGTVQASSAEFTTTTGSMTIVYTTVPWVQNYNFIYSDSGTAIQTWSNVTLLAGNGITIKSQPILTISGSTSATIYIGGLLPDHLYAAIITYVNSGGITMSSSLMQIKTQPLTTTTFSGITSQTFLNQSCVQSGNTYSSCPAYQSSKTSRDQRFTRLITQRSNKYTNAQLGILLQRVHDVIQTKYTAGITNGSTQSQLFSYAYLYSLFDNYLSSHTFATATTSTTPSWVTASTLISLRSSLTPDQFLGLVCAGTTANFYACGGFASEQSKRNARLNTQITTMRAYTDYNKILVLADLRLGMQNNFYTILNQLDSTQPIPVALFAAAYSDRRIRNYVTQDSTLGLMLYSTSSSLWRGNSTTPRKLIGNGTTSAGTTISSGLQLTYDRYGSEVGVGWSNYLSTATTAAIAVSTDTLNYRTLNTVAASDKIFRFTRTAADHINARVTFDNGQVQAIDIPVGDTYTRNTVTTTNTATKLILTPSPTTGQTYDSFDITLRAADTNNATSISYTNTVTFSVQKLVNGTRTTASSSDFNLSRTSYAFSTTYQGAVQINDLIAFTSEGTYRLIATDTSNSSVYGSVDIVISGIGGTNSSTSTALTNLDPVISVIGNQVNLTRDSSDLDTDVGQVAVYYRFNDGTQEVYGGQASPETELVTLNLTTSGKYQFLFYAVDSSNTRYGQPVSITRTIP